MAKALLFKTPLRLSWLDWACEALTATLAAQILALPLILYQFGNLSVIALAGGMAWLPLGQWLALQANLFLAWLTEGARLFATLPYAAVQLPPFPLWLLLAYYAIVVGAWLWTQSADGSGR
jgi:competence protein ComEC